MRRVLFLLMLCATICAYGQRWDQAIIPGDKVEQTPPTDAWLYSDESVLLLLMPYRDAFSIAPTNERIALTRTYVKGATISGANCTIAAFDDKQQRVGYWNNVLLISYEGDKSLICFDKVQTEQENKNCSWKVFSHLKNKSGSIVFRLTGDKGELLDYEIKTIKTLGYDDKNGKHWDGDIDVIGM